MVWPERPKAEKGELAGRDAANKCQNYLKADLENESWSRIGAAERWSSPASAPPRARRAQDAAPWAVYKGGDRQVQRLVR